MGGGAAGRHLLVSWDLQQFTGEPSGLGEVRIAPVLGSVLPWELHQFS